MIVCTGGVTDRLKKDWGINDVWNRIILPRFIRLDEMMGKGMFTARSENGHLIPSMPLEFQKGFSKKRIDHRHHAMDAIVIACADRSMVNYLNNESARKKSEISRQGLQNLLCDKVKTDDKGNYKWVVKKPWNTYTQDVYDVLKSIIVSFKQNLRVINKTINKSVRFVNGKKKLVEQSTVNWSIRKPLHKDTLYGEVNLRKKKPVSLKDAIRNPSRIVDKELKKIVCMKLAEGYDLKRLKKFFQDNKDVWPEGQSKIEVYYFTKETEDRYFADREALDDTFTAKKIKDHVTDTGIQKILLRHLELNDNDPKMAFSPEGIDEMNWNIIQLNNGKFHHPIRKVRCCEKSNKFAVGTKGRKFTKFVEGAKGTNLYFAVYETEIINKKTGELMKKRSFATIPFKTVMTRQIQGLKSVPADVDGNEPIFTLSPGDLVYIPDNDGKVGHSLDTDRLYRMVSSKAYQCFFIKVNVATSIVDKVEFTSSNKMERAVTGEMIKEVCIPVKVDRLGNITQLG